MIRSVRFIDNSSEWFLTDFQNHDLLEALDFLTLPEPLSLLNGAENIATVHPLFFPDSPGNVFCPVLELFDCCGK